MEETERVCRFCFDAEPVADLCSPCACSGSIALVHRDCLLRWRATVLRGGGSLERVDICSTCSQPFGGPDIEPLVVTVWRERGWKRGAAALSRLPVRQQHSLHRLITELRRWILSPASWVLLLAVWVCAWDGLTPWLAPPPDPSARAGVLLVATPEASGPGDMWHESVILLLEHHRFRGSKGVIVSVHHHHHHYHHHPPPKSPPRLSC